MDTDWLEMKSIRKRRLTSTVWVPLRAAERIGVTGRVANLGFREEFFGAGTVAIPISKRDAAEKLGWSEIGLIHNQGVFANQQHYKPADVYWEQDGIALGIELVLEQTFHSSEKPEWHLNQDVVFALGLLRQGDRWVRPAEDYLDVVRLRRDSNGSPVAVEMKNEHLRDYLAARKMVLRIASYRKREMVIDENVKVAWPNGELVERAPDDRFEARAIKMLEGGHPIDAGYAVFRVSRTDVDQEADVPEMGPENDTNTASTSWTGTRSGRGVLRVTGELWRNELVEPADKSSRVRGDRVPTGVSYIVDASGKRLSSEELDNADVGRWLWFHPKVIQALIGRRGGALTWYTKETGGVACSAEYGLVHFGVNSIGLINVYAYDVAKLPAWQQQIWAAFNASPDGGVSAELLMAHVDAVSAETEAPESVLPEVLSELDKTFERLAGRPLFRTHSITNDLIASVHRFRALMPGGVLALAKDLVRVTADRIDTAALQKIVPPPEKAKWGSIKSLEKFLATVVEADEARMILGPIAGAYDLRVGDAHLPGSDLAKSYELAGVDPNAPELKQGFALIASFVSSLLTILKVLGRHRDGERPAPDNES